MLWWLMPPVMLTDAIRLGVAFALVVSFFF
jgi:hypothetical protein